MPVVEDMVCFVDVETGGLDPAYHDILEIAAILTDWDLKEISRYEARIRPRNPDRIDPAAAKVNGYDPELWSGSAVHFAEFQGWLSKHVPYGHVAIPIGHNVGFDRAFIESYYKPFGKWMPLSYHQCDTVGLAAAMKIAKAIDVPNLKLATVGAALGIQKPQTHRAMDDCLMARQILLNIVGVLQS